MATGRFRVPSSKVGGEELLQPCQCRCVPSWPQLMGYILVAAAAFEQLPLLLQSRLEPQHSDKASAEKAESSPHSAEQGPWDVLSHINKHLGGDAEKRHYGPFIFNSKCHLILLLNWAWFPLPAPLTPTSPAPQGQCWSSCWNHYVSLRQIYSFSSWVWNFVEKRTDDSRICEIMVKQAEVDLKGKRPM